MKLYKVINDVPVKSWDDIQKSFINELPDLTPLIVRPTIESSNYSKRKYEKLIKTVKTSKKKQDKLLKHYLTLLYEMQDVDVTLTKLYTELKLKLIEYNLQIEKNGYRKLQGYGKLDNKKYPVNKVFNQYLKELNKNYTDFEYKFNYIINDYEKQWKKIFKTEVPKELKEQMSKYGLGFYLWEEYFYLINTWDFDLRMVMSTQRFQEIFIKQKVVKVDDIEELNKRLLKDFKDNKEFDKYFALRFDFFDMIKLKYRAKKQSTILSELISLSRILEINIDAENTTIGQLQMNYRKSADLIIENHKKNDRS